MKKFVEKIRNADWMTKGSIILNCFLVLFLLFSFALNDNKNQTEIQEKKEVTLFKDGDVLSGGEYDTVIVSSALKDGSVLITGVTIRDLVINGGGENTVIVEDSSVDNVVLEKEEGQPVRLLLKGRTKAKNIDVKSNSIIESESEDIEVANIKSSNKKINVELRSLKVANLDLHESSNLISDEKTTFRKVAETSEITVVFENENGDKIEEKKLVRGLKVQSLDFKKDGYEFKGWEHKGNLFDFEKTIMNSIVLVPRLEEIKEANTSTPSPSRPAPTPSPTPSPKPSEPKPEPTPEPEPINYTFTTQTIVGSTAVRVTAFKNNSVVSINQVMDANGNLLGAMTDEGYVTTDASLSGLIKKARLTSGEVINF